MTDEKALWIWYPGEYELYHSLRLHTVREDFGRQYPSPWRIAPLYTRVNFSIDYDIKEDNPMRIVSPSFGFVLMNGGDMVTYPLNKDFVLPAGHGHFEVRLMNIDGTLPCLFIDSPAIKTGTHWTADDTEGRVRPAAALPIYDAPEKLPTVFPYEYEPLSYVKKEKIDGGYLFDFGKETFAALLLSKMPREKVNVVYGESREEALSPRDAYISEEVSGAEKYRLKCRAFRYVSLFGATEKTEASALYEVLPLAEIGSFSCNEKEVGEVYAMCAYTFHLCSRAVFIDGIKRDHWAWSGDAYQSYRINNYLYFDPEITKRTICSLLGKPPYARHVNGINDYTMYLILSVYEYYFSTGDLAFVRDIFDRVTALYDFLLSRLDEDGLVCAREGDWIFIDWSDIDKEGPACAEQILLWQTRRTMAKLYSLFGDDRNARREEAAATALAGIVYERFWDGEKGAFIDSYVSGRRKVSRHPAVFALLFDFGDEKMRASLLQNVLQNDSVTAITTPYFKFFELTALCKCGLLTEAQKMLSSYWGGMRALSATSVWEQFDPNEKGEEHYAMYGRRFGRSLCHAWGSGPIYFLGRFCLGVEPTDVGYRTFSVRPQAGRYTSFSGVVPLPNGKRVSVAYENGLLTVSSDARGGTVFVKDKSFPLLPNEPLTVECAL